MEYFEPGRVRTEVESNLRKSLRLDSGFDRFCRNATAIFGGLAIFTSVMLYSTIKDDYQRSQRTARTQIQERRIDTISTKIDRDELSDLIIDGRIFLANQTPEGMNYKQLGDSDIYRIK